jgi:hypothetical protein
MRFESILEWYSGKGRDTIVNFTIPALVECEALGYWKKGVSRTVQATLNKQNIAAQWARKVEKTFGETSFGSFHLRLDHPLNEAQSNMLFGSFGRAPRTLQALLATTIFSTEVKPYAQDAIRWASAFAPVAELVALLDSRRPKAVVVMKTLSPTVAANISKTIGMDISTLRSPPMHGEWFDFTWKGQKMRVWQVVIDWPEGTKHGASKYHGTENNDQCEACGHAIQNPFNWVPLLADAHWPDGDVQVSLWVGRDCAAKLFGCKVEGDAIYKR